MEKQERTYSPEFKLKAVEPSNLREVIGAGGVRTGYPSKEPGRRWKQGYGAGKLDGTSKPTLPKNSGELEDMALRKASHGAELERDIPKRRPAPSPRQLDNLTILEYQQSIKNNLKKQPKNLFKYCPLFIWNSRYRVILSFDKKKGTKGSCLIHGSCHLTMMNGKGSWNP